LLLLYPQLTIFIMAGLKFATVALMLVLCISGSMAQLNIPPATLTAITQACGAGALLGLAASGNACYTASMKPMKKCPAACASLIAGVPNKACADAVFKATPAKNRKNVVKVSA
jgi:hypothetical protein